MLEDQLEKNTSATIALLEAIHNLTTAMINQGTPVSKPPRKRKTKAEMEAEKAAEIENATEVEGTRIKPATNLGLGLDDVKVAPDLKMNTEILVEKDKPTTTFDQMNAAAKQLVECSTDQEGLIRARKIIADAGFKQMKDVPEDKYSDFCKAFKKEAANWNKKVNTQL